LGSELLSIASLYDAPEREDGSAAVSDLSQWGDVVTFARTRSQDGQGITAADLSAAFGLSAPTGRRYLDHLLEMFPDEWEIAIVPKKRGRPARTIQLKTPG